MFDGQGKKCAEMAEALGLTFPGSALLPATSPNLLEFIGVWALQT